MRLSGNRLERYVPTHPPAPEHPREVERRSAEPSLHGVHEAANQHRRVRSGRERLGKEKWHGTSSSRRQEHASGAEHTAH